MVLISDNGTGEKGNGTSRSKETEQYNENSFRVWFVTTIISKMFHTEGISIANDMKQPLKDKQGCTAFVITKGKTGIEL